jgi:uncharacterized phage protein gp47/JayE
MTVNPLLVHFDTLQIPTSIDYTSKDFSGFAASMLAYAAQAFPEWNTASEGDMGVMLMEIFAYGLDIISYYGDRLTKEAYLSTATQLLSVYNIANMLGYVPSNGSPSSGTVIFKTDNPGPAVTVPTGTQVVAVGLDTPVIFETQDTVVVQANGVVDDTNSVEVIQGVTMHLVPIGVSDGTLGQKFVLPQLDVIDGTVQVWVQTSVGSQEWVQVAYLIDSGADDQVYSLATDQTGATTVSFGDNENGTVPAVGLQIWATYRVGVGSAGNLLPGAVDTFVTPIPGVSLQPLGVGAGPSTAMIGGADPETIEQIRANAPTVFQAQYRAVSPQDFTALALSVPGVLMANAIAQRSSAVTLYIMGPNYTGPGPALQQSILSFFKGKTAAGCTVSIVPPTIVLIDAGSVGNPIQLVVQDAYLQASVLANVKTAIQALFTPPNVAFGQLINVSQIYGAVLAVPGVSYVVVPVFTREDAVQVGTAPIQLNPGEVASSGVQYISVTGGIV